MIVATLEAAIIAITGDGIVLSIGGYSFGIVSVTTPPAAPAEVVIAATIRFLSFSSGNMCNANGLFAISYSPFKSPAQYLLIYRRLYILGSQRGSAKCRLFLLQ